MSTDFLPDGETRRKSTSAGNACENPLMVTETRWITPTSPATVIAEGYTLAACPGPPDAVGQGLGQSVIVIAVELVNDVARAGLSIGALATLDLVPLIELLVMVRTV
ncbi:MAG: hypothetical protein DMF69_10490 [Acidobacteria bacterium]|nr:MAG: hypothetical protein DMF69_10490 [Acidobacteriota bacterium]